MNIVSNLLKQQYSLDEFEWNNNTKQAPYAVSARRDAESEIQKKNKINTISPNIIYIYLTAVRTAARTKKIAAFLASTRLWCASKTTVRNDIISTKLMYLVKYKHKTTKKQ